MSQIIRFLASFTEIVVIQNACTNTTGCIGWKLNKKIYINNGYWSANLLDLLDHRNHRRIGAKSFAQNYENHQWLNTRTTKNIDVNTIKFTIQNGIKTITHNWCCGEIRRCWQLCNWIRLIGQTLLLHVITLKIRAPIIFLHAFATEPDSQSRKWRTMLSR